MITLILGVIGSIIAVGLLLAIVFALVFGAGIGIFVLMLLPDLFFIGCIFKKIFGKKKEE